jgi:hypothetical protein
MWCPECGDKTDVTDTRAAGSRVRRVRVCKPCGYRLPTVELAAHELKELERGRAVLLDLMQRPALIDLVKPTREAKARRAVQRPVVAAGGGPIPKGVLSFDCGAPIAAHGEARSSGSAAFSSVTPLAATAAVRSSGTASLTG